MTRARFPSYIVWVWYEGLRNKKPWAGWVPEVAIVHTEHPYARNPLWAAGDYARGTWGKEGGWKVRIRPTALGPPKGKPSPRRYCGECGRMSGDTRPGQHYKPRSATVCGGPPLAPPKA